MNLIQNFLSELNLSTLSIPRINLSDVVDILIVAYFIYGIMLWVKETRAWTLFKGIAVIILISALAFLFDLYTISWIVENAFNVGIIALLVVFQPELRKALEEIGKGKINVPFIGSKNDGMTLSQKSVEELVRAAKVLSQAKTGALIAIQQEVALGDLEQTGIPIDAHLSSQLLLNIFEDKTPLHDGAVIVKENRIAAAMCILPLTQDEIGREYGTRHRAAVGASEVSDALVLVVSEETGNMSVAKGGKLYKHLSETEVREMLSKPKAEEKSLFLWKGRQKNEKSS